MLVNIVVYNIKRGLVEDIEDPAMERCLLDILTFLIFRKALKLRVPAVG